jgi:hypothetical protein
MPMLTTRTQFWSEYKDSGGVIDGCDVELPAGVSAFQLTVSSSRETARPHGVRTM